MLTGRATRTLAGLTLFALNVWITWPLFFTEYTEHFGSVQPFFFAIAKAVRIRWPDLGWWPAWNLGMPFEYTYQPLLHYLVAAAAAATGWSEARAYHFVIATLYSLGPVALYCLVLRLTRRPVAGFLSGLLYTFFSPSALLIGGIVIDMGGWWYPRRFHALVAYADAPNIAGLTFLPVAILFLDRALERRSPRSWALAAIGIATVPLTNIPAAMALALALVAYALGLDRRSWPKLWPRIAGLGAMAYLLFAPWLPPSGLALAAANAQWMDPKGQLSLDKLPYYLAFGTAIGVACILLHRWKLSLMFRFAALFTLLTSTVTLLSAWMDVDLIGQAGRFHIAMEMAIVLLITCAFLVPIRWTVLRGVALSVPIVILSAFQWDEHRYYVRRMVSKGEIATRSEYKVARWMEANAHGDRVYVPGSTAFWLNYWTDTPQVWGCCDQNRLLDVLRGADGTVGTDRGATNIAIAWFQVLGVHYVAVNGPNSNDAYKDMAGPRSFDGVLRELNRDGDDIIYEVPLASPSLAHVVRPRELVSRKPVSGADIQPLEAYRAAVMDASRPLLRFSWTSPHDAVIQGTLPEGFIVSVQVPYHPGWHAATESGSVPLSADALGFMAVSPSCNGPCSVRLTFDGGPERTVLWSFAILAWSMLAVLFLVHRLRAKKM